MNLTKRQREVIKLMQKGWMCHNIDSPALSCEQPALVGPTKADGVQVVRRPMLGALMDAGLIDHPRGFRGTVDWGAYVLTPKGKDFETSAATESK